METKYNLDVKCNLFMKLTLIHFPFEKINQLCFVLNPKRKKIDERKQNNATENFVVNFVSEWWWLTTMCILCNCHH